MALDIALYKDELDDIIPGQTIRVNHISCPAGEDTRRRLYLTRTIADGTKVVGYCHNCQQGGAYSTTTWSSYRNSKHNRVYLDDIKVSDVIEEPPGLVGDLTEWPSNAKAWAYTRYLYQEDIDWYDIKYDPSTDRVYLPRYFSMQRGSNTRGTLAGYQLRKTYEMQQPKYLTVQKKDAQNWTYILNKDDSQDYAIIVEDLVSAIHIIRATEEEGMGGVLPSVVVNYGTKIDPTLMYHMAANHKSVTVWLDNDNNHVNHQAKQMERTIGMYNRDIKVARVTGYTDPKHFSKQEICRILDEVWSNG